MPIRYSKTPLAALTLSPDPAASGNELVAQVDAEDADGDPLEIVYSWSVDGTPVALFGWLYFSGILVWLILIGRVDHARRRLQAMLEYLADQTGTDVGDVDEFDIALIEDLVHSQFESIAAGN